MALVKSLVLIPPRNAAAARGGGGAGGRGGHVSLARLMYSQACSYLASYLCYLFKNLKRVFAPFEFET